LASGEIRAALFQIEFQLWPDRHSVAGQLRSAKTLKVGIGSVMR
jgi:hypothetical protein